MALLSSKWLLLPVFLILILVALYFIGKKSVHSEIVIPASTEQVWSVLMDSDNYAQWNQVLELLEGHLQEGSKVTYRFHQDEDNAYEITSTVKRRIENKLLNQTGGMPGILTFDHRYILESVAAGTKVTIHEDYRGIGVSFWNPEVVEAAYIRLNQSLKDRVTEVYGR